VVSGKKTSIILNTTFPTSIWAPYREASELFRNYRRPKTSWPEPDEPAKIIANADSSL